MTASISRAAELFSAFLLAATFAVIQVLIGGTRLLFSLPAYGLLAVIGLLALASLRRAKPAPDQLCLISAAVFFSYILTRALFSPVSYLARSDIYSVLGGLLVYLFVACIFTGPKQRMFLVFFLLALALVHVGIGAIQFRDENNYMLIPHLHRYDYGRRASGLYVCPNHLAGLLEVLGVFGLSIGWWSRWPSWAKLTVLYVAGVCYFGLAITGSRGGYLSTAASVLVFAAITLLLLRRLSSKIYWRVVVLSTALAAMVILSTVILFQKSDFLRSRAGNTFETQNMRIDLWKAAVDQWKLQPVIGTGSGTYLYYGRQFRTTRMQLDPVRAHNDYLDLLAEYGLVGATCFLIFLALHLRNGWRNLKRLRPQRVGIAVRLLSNGMALQVAAIAAVSAYVVHSIFDFNLHIPANVLLLAFVLGMIANPGIHRQNDFSAMAVPSGWWWRLLLPVIGVVLAIQCIRLLPGEYFAERARTALRDKHAGTTIRFALRGLETEHNNPNLYDYVGNAQIIRGDARSKPEERTWFYRRALEAFLSGRRLAPQDEGFALELGYAYDALGRFTEAEWMFSEALRLDPKSNSTKGYYEKHLQRWREAGSAPQ